MTQEERYRLGTACRQILGGDDFKFVVAKVREDILNAWMASGLDEGDKQAQAKRAMHGLDLILSKLATFADDAKLLDAEAQQEQERAERAQRRKDKQEAKLKELGIRP